MNDTNQLPVLTHRELPSTKPTQSSQSPTSLSDVIGSFDFSLCLYCRQSQLDLWGIVLSKFLELS